MIGRYARNIGAITEQEQKTLLSKTVLIVGVGGLGGYSAEYLGRMGIKELRLCDCDAFDESNLNRQINSSERNLGRRKVVVAKERIESINSDVKVVIFDERFDGKSAAKMLDGVDLVIDALDNITSRLVLEEEVARAGVPLVFGAISGWDGQISTIIPGKPILKKLFKDFEQQVLPVLPFTAACVSAYQAAEAVKVMLGRGELIGKLMLIDLEMLENRIIAL